MSLNAALKDRARLVTRAAEPGRVEGKTVASPAIDSAWFKCRLELPEAGFTPGPGDRRRVVSAPTLMFGLRDAEGQPVVMLARRHKVEVESVAQGRAGLWEVKGDPAPIRKKRRVIGWSVTLSKVEDRDFAAPIVP